MKKCFKVVLLLCLLVALLSSLHEDIAAISNPAWRYLANGAAGDVDRRPSLWLIAIVTRGAGGAITQVNHCAATAISERTMFTAAHCLKGGQIGVNDVYAIDYDRLQALARATPNISWVDAITNNTGNIIHAQSVDRFGFAVNDVSVKDMGLVVFNNQQRFTATSPISCTPPTQDQAVTLAGFMKNYVKKGGANLADVSLGGPRAEIFVNRRGTMPEDGDSGSPLLRADAIVGICTGEFAWARGFVAYANPNRPGLAADLRGIFNRARQVDPTVPLFPCPPGQQNAVPLPPPGAEDLPRIVALPTPHVPDSCVAISVNGLEPAVCCNDSEPDMCELVSVRPGDTVTVSATPSFSDDPDGYPVEFETWEGFESPVSTETFTFTVPPGLPPTSILSPIYRYLGASPPESEPSPPWDDIAYTIGGTPHPACDDGVDNDGDELIDHPDDPGCDDEYDEDETHTPPACRDGIDNDADGFIDYPDDRGCIDLEGNTEFDEFDVPVDRRRETDGSVNGMGRLQSLRRVTHAQPSILLGVLCVLALVQMPSLRFKRPRTED